MAAPILGDLLYRAVSLWTRLAGNTTTTRKYLSQTGTGAASAVPVWNQVTDADLSTSNITTNNVTIAKHGFTPILPNDATKYLDGTGAYTVPAGTGGSGTVTNTGTLTDHQVVIANGGVDVSTLGSLGTSGQVLTSGGAGVDPSWTTISGTGTVTNTGTLTSGKSIIGNGGVDVTVSALTAQFVGSSSGTAAAASMTTARLLGRTTASSGAVEELTVGTGLSLSAGSLTATGSGGGLALLESHTASASASLDFTTAISATYDRYLIVCDGLLPTTNGDAIGIRFNVGGGFDSGNNYRLATSIGTESGFATQVASTSASRIDIFPSVSNGTTGGLNFTAELCNVNSGAKHKRVDIQGDALNSGDGNFYYIGGFGRYAVVTAVTQFQIIASTSTLASGTVYCFGYAK